MTDELLSDLDWLPTLANLVGDTVFSVKWRSLKVHFLTAQGTFAPIVQHTFPQVFDIKNDPGETREVFEAEGYSQLRVTKPVMEILGGLAISMKQYPNIPPGQDFDGYK